MNRFRDNGKYNVEFQKCIAVTCPVCQKMASVLSDGKVWRPCNTKLFCENCRLVETKGNNRWYGPMIGLVKRRCYQCGRRLKKNIKGPKHSYQYNLVCPGCGCEMLEPIVWTRQFKPTACDPHFGLRLWFVGSVKGNEFWAYNREHLAFLKNYVSAKVRVREPNLNSSLVSRLPTWMLSAKNRQAVIREISKLERKFQ